MNTLFSVICLTYNSDITKTLTTLNSVIKQKDCDFEVIIADDGSKNNNVDVIEQYFKSNNFFNYKVRANKVNQGIIENYLSAIELARGKYIKYISPGDYLYDEATLKKCLDFMNKYNAELAFGKAVYYSYENNKLDILVRKNPVLTEMYDAKREDYNFDLVLKNLILWQDGILGAAVMADRLVFEKYLREISGKVKYIEDNTIMPLATMDKKRIYFLDEYILWYECDSGISTNSNRGFKEKIDIDFLNCYEYLTKKDSKNKCIRFAYLKQKYYVQKKRFLLFCVKRILDIFYGRIVHKRYHRKKRVEYVLREYSTEHWYKWQNVDFR